MRHRSILMSLCLLLAGCDFLRDQGQPDALRGPGAGNDNGSGGEAATIAIASFAFVPREVTVSVGDTVVWRNSDSVLHTVTSGTPDNPGTLFDSGELLSDETFEFTFTQPGVFSYFCGFHRTDPNEVNATVTVESGSSAP